MLERIERDYQCQSTPTIAATNPEPTVDRAAPIGRQMGPS